jgi:RNA polymerase sigma factor (sigma-70 family)
MDDHELLREYVERRSEPAFTELVARHVNLVYSTARRLGSEPQLAQDVAQSVFLQLARKAGTVRDGRVLAAWLYRVARAATVDALRSEHRRRVRECAAMSAADTGNEADAAWAAVAPLLDEAMRRLKPAEMDAVVLRFFEGKSLREVGDALTLSEDGAQKRISRALEKMRAYFVRQGVTATAALLGTVISTNSVQAAPAGLAASVAAGSLAGAVGAGWVVSLKEILAMTTKTKALVVTAIVLLAAAGPLAWQWRDNARLRTQVAAAQSENKKLGGSVDAVEESGAGGDSARLTDAEIEAQVQAVVRGVRASRDWSVSPSYAEWLKFLNSVKAADMSRVLAHVERVADKYTRNGLRAILLGIWAKSDVPAALACAQAIPANEDYDARDYAILQVMDQWVKQDLPAAEAFVAQLPANGRRDYLLLPLAQELAPKDPQGAFDLVKSLSSEVGGLDGTNISLAWGQVIDNWPKTDFPNAGQQVEALPFEDHFYALQDLAGNWAAVDPAAAAAWGATLSDGRDKNQFTDSIFSTWAKSDQTGALSAAEQLTDPAQQKAALNAIVTSWMRTDPQGAMAYVQAMPSGPVRDALLQNVSFGMVSGDPETMAKTVDDLPDGPVRDAAVLNLVHDWAAEGGAEAMDGEKNDILDAAAWSEALSNSTLRANAYNVIMASWARDDPAAAEQWIMTLPVDEARDQAVYAFAAYNGNAYPADTAHLAETMANTSDRGIALYNAGLAWLQQDRPAATAWVAQSTLFSDKEKKRLLGNNWNASP